MTTGAEGALSDRSGLTEPVIRWMMTRPDGRELPEFSDSLRRPAWMERSACRGEPVGTFLPERGQSIRRAQELCDGCPVRMECLSYDLDKTDTAGSWGGAANAAGAACGARRAEGDMQAASDSPGRPGRHRVDIEHPRAQLYAR